MSPAVSVQHVSKRYQIGQAAPVGGSFREVIASAFTAPGRRLRRLGGRAADETFWAVRDVSFDVEAGEVVGIIGRNGAGKSTLLKVLSRITEPTRGRIELRGRVASLLEVGTGFHPDLTGRENIFLNGAILGMSRAEIRRNFDAIVDFAEVAPFLETAVKHYSSGMYLRLAFAVAAHLAGEILLVDEVLAVGDAAFQQKCLGKLRDVSRGGRAVLFISHNMTALSGLCSRGIVLDGGVVRFDGPIREAVPRYLAQHLDDAATTWQVEAVPRRLPELGGAARLVSASAVLTTAEGFTFGEAMRFRLSFDTRTPLDHLVFAVNLDDAAGNRIVTFESDGGDDRLAHCGAGRHDVEVAIPPFGLRPGKYMVSASIHSGGHYYDYLTHFGAIAVLPFDAARRYVHDRPEYGPIYVPAAWTRATEGGTV